MAKRRRASPASLTGGTGDVKPQIMTMAIPPATVAAEYSVLNFPLPVPRIGATKDLATITEILRVDWYPDIGDTADVDVGTWAFLSTNSTRASGDASSTASAASDAADPLTFAMVFQRRAFTTSGASVVQFPISINLTDGAGNGILVATDRLFAVAGAIGNTTQSITTGKVWYRLVNVGITEYVGIVQSQQAG